MAATPTGSERASATRSRRLSVLVRPGDALGFRMAGAAVETAAAGTELAVLRGLLADPTVGVLAVEEELLSSVPQRLLQRARQRGVPVILPFSIPRHQGGAGRGREYVAALIRRAIGYAVRLAGGGGAS